MRFQGRSENVNDDRFLFAEELPDGMPHGVYAEEMLLLALLLQPFRKYVLLKFDLLGSFQGANYSINHKILHGNDEIET